MRPSKVVLLVVGCLAALVSIGLVIGGGGLIWAHATQRDSSGYFSTSTQRFETASYALTSEHIDLGADVPDSEWSLLDDIGTARIVVRSTNDAPVFVGIARHSDIERYLARTAHDEITDVRFSPFRPTYRSQAGETPPAPPEAQPFWVASISGAGQQTLTWDIERGEWDVVVMNADARRGVSVEASAGIEIGFLLALGFALMAAGLAGGAVATVLVLVALKDDVRPGSGPAPLDGAPSETSAPAHSYPLRLDARLDEPLSRWMWLVKWFLVIPHLLVLAFLWMAFAVLTVVAGFTILVTERYPRAIFDFNVGVLRWTWRVTFYAFSLGTDRYPPFSLQPVSGYPADLTVDYPQRLSRPLVLVKWWLLALPHYLVIGIFGGGLTWWTWAGDGGGRAAVGGGLIGILVLVAGVMLTATRRYPRPVFDFVMGMHRWTYRVWAYAALMCDEYPPFRLDNGGPDPCAPLSDPHPPRPDIDDRLVGTAGTSQL